MYAAGLGPHGPAMCPPLHRRVHGVTPETAPAMCARAPRRRPGLLHVCTGGDQRKTQEEQRLVSGLKDHRYLSKKK